MPIVIPVSKNTANYYQRGNHEMEPEHATGVIRGSYMDIAITTGGVIMKWNQNIPHMGSLKEHIWT